MKEKTVAVLLAVLLAGCAAQPKQIALEASSSVDISSTAQAEEKSADLTVPQQDNPKDEKTEDQQIYEKLYEKLSVLENKNCIGMTNKQMLEDYDFLYQTLLENYPYIGVAKRKVGADLSAYYQEGRKRMESCETDADFYVEILKLVNSMQGVGHLSLFNPSRCLKDQEVYQELLHSGSEEDLADEKPWIEDTLHPVAIKNMPAWDKMVTAPLLAAISEVQAQAGEAMQNDTPRSNVETKIFEEGKTAYVSIQAFDMDCYDDDKEILFAFYRQVADYDNLIIDITENGGGGMGYYMDLLVAPQLDSTIYWRDYIFAKDGPGVRKYYPNIAETFLPIDANEADIQAYLDRELADYSAQDHAKIKSLGEKIGIPDKMNQEDLSDLDYFAPSLMSIAPLEGGKIFKGKIWLLVSENVYSSSESFASFAKSTGFALLVGTRTGGDGIGSTPLLFVLPNSGLIGRYSWVYGTTLNGTGSEEFGTLPDFPSRDGESALDTCLRVIAETQPADATNPS